MAEQQQSTTETEVLSPLVVRRTAAVLDVDGDAVVAAGTLPPLWHWMIFTDIARQSDLGADGHPDRRTRGETDEDVARFPRRMFAGGRLRIEQDLHIGARAERRSEVVSVTEKEGSSGALRFVTLRDEISDDRGGRVVEERDIVYLGAQAGSASVATAPPDAPDAPWEDGFVPDEPLLFRFSAVTFNSHRIHYDHPYTTGVEGYPALVVHGPLLAVKLCELGRREASGPVREFSFRARQPVFLGEQVALRGWPDGARAELAAYSRGSEPAMKATLGIAT